MRTRNLLLLGVVAASVVGVTETAGARKFGCMGREATIVGRDDQRDRIIGTDGPDVIVSLGGDDQVRGGLGDDVICTGDDEDRAYGGSGDDIIHLGITGGCDEDLGDCRFPRTGAAGGGGDDRLLTLGKAILEGGPGRDRLEGSNANDWLRGGLGLNVVDGNGGNDFTFYRTRGVVVDLKDGAAKASSTHGMTRDLLIEVENVSGSQGDDVVYGDARANEIRSGRGDDRFFGRGGDDRLEGGQDDDRLIGGSGNDDLHGGADANHLEGGDGRDAASFNLHGGMTEGVRVDLVVGYALVDDAFTRLIGIEDVTTTYYGDVVIGDDNDNRIELRGGADEVDAGGGNDTLLGHAGDDRLNGGDGFDILVGGGGDDECTEGEDTSGCEQP